MKTLDEFKASIACYDAQCIELLEKLDELDPTSEEYEKVEKSLKTMLEIKQIEVENMNSVKESMIPGWATSALGIVSGLLSIGVILFGEFKGGVIGTSATSMLNKIRIGK